MRQERAWVIEETKESRVLCYRQVVHITYSLKQEGRQTIATRLGFESCNCGNGPRKRIMIDFPRQDKLALVEFIARSPVKSKI
jgi:hypothetical protein